MRSTLLEILADADKRGYAVPAFNINNLEILQAVVEAAIEEKSPVILQTSEGAIAYAGMEYLVAMANIAMSESPVPVAMHLDHGKDEALIAKAIATGYGSVMIDASLMPLEKNIETTKRVVAMAKKNNVGVEAELGAIKGVEDLVSVEERQAFFTDPKQAVQFVEESGCDALAVSIGTAHGAHKFKSEPVLDLNRLAEIDSLVNVPLVLHGASGISSELVEKTKHLCEKLGDCGRLADAIGVPDTQVSEAVKRGIRKVNIDSDLRIAFTAGIRDSILLSPNEFDPRKLMALSKSLMKELARHKMQLLGSSGKA